MARTRSASLLPVSRERKAAAPSSHSSNEMQVVRPRAENPTSIPRTAPTAGCGVIVCQPDDGAHPSRPERLLACLPERPRGRGRVERFVRPPRLLEMDNAPLPAAIAASICSKERVFPAATSRRDLSISARNPGWVLSARDSLSTFRRGTIAATGRFRSVSTTTSSSSSLAYSASGREAFESARVFISL